MENPHIVIQAARGGYVVEAFAWESEEESLEVHVFTDLTTLGLFIVKNLQKAEAYQSARAGGPLRVPRRPRGWNAKSPGDTPPPLE